MRKAIANDQGRDAYLFCASVRLRSERVAGVGIAGRQPAPEPFHTLCGRAVGESVGSNVPSRHPLKAVVADGCCGAQTGLDITFLEFHFSARCSPLLRGRMAPHASKTISL